MLIGPIIGRERKWGKWRKHQPLQGQPRGNLGDGNGQPVSPAEVDKSRPGCYFSHRKTPAIDDEPAADPRGDTPPVEVQKLRAVAQQQDGVASFSGIVGVRAADRLWQVAGDFLSHLWIERPDDRSAV